MTVLNLPGWSEAFLTVTLPDGTKAQVEMPVLWRTFLEQLAEAVNDHEDRIEALEP